MEDMVKREMFKSIRMARNSAGIPRRFAMRTAYEISAGLTKISATTEWIPNVVDFIFNKVGVWSSYGFTFFIHSRKAYDETREFHARNLIGNTIVVQYIIEWYRTQQIPMEASALRLLYVTLMESANNFEERGEIRSKVRDAKVLFIEDVAPPKKGHKSFSYQNQNSLMFMNTTLLERMGQNKVTIVSLAVAPQNFSSGGVSLEMTSTFGSLDSCRNEIDAKRRCVLIDLDN